MSLREKAKNLPASPGVYLMKDSSNSIIYVGKSKNLNSRVRSYLQNSKNHSKKVEKMVHHLKDFEIILTDTEFEALMLECRLIKKWKPLYNRMMKSPQSYTYILFHFENGLHKMKLTQQKGDDGGLYFGPYTSKSTVERAITGLKEFLKMDCNSSSNKKSPCLNYSIGLCMGVCFDPSANLQYQQNIDKIIAMLEGRDLTTVDDLEQKMHHAASNFDYERAAKLRDCIDAVNTLLRKEKVIDFFTTENKFMIVLERVDPLSVKMFLINRNTVLLNKIIEIEDTNIKQLSDQMKASIVDHYKTTLDSFSHQISKEELDEAQIIYSYVNSEACVSLMIPEKWLTTEHRDHLETAIKDFLITKLVKVVN